MREEEASFARRFQMHAKRSAKGASLLSQPVGVSVPGNAGWSMRVPSVVLVALVMALVAVFVYVIHACRAKAWSDRAVWRTRVHDDRLGAPAPTTASNKERARSALDQRRRHLSPQQIIDKYAVVARSTAPPPPRRPAPGKVVHGETRA